MLKKTMIPQHALLPVVFAFACNLAAADALILKDGQKIEDRYLSSTDSSVQFEVDGKPFTYSTWLIRELRLHSGGNRTARQARHAGPRGKEQQGQFCAVLKKFVQARNKVSAEPNPIRRAEMRPPDPWSYENAIAHVFGPDGEFVDWTGRLFFSVTGSNVVLAFQPTCGFGPAISFTNGYPGDRRRSARSARIVLSSPLADKLRDASPGNLFRVSGHLFVKPEPVSPAVGSRTDARQHFESPQANGIGNVTNPQYLAQFIDVARSSS